MGPQTVVAAAVVAFATLLVAIAGTELDLAVAVLSTVGPVG